MNNIIALLFLPLFHTCVLDLFWGGGGGGGGERESREGIIARLLVHVGGVADRCFLP